MRDFEFREIQLPPSGVFEPRIRSVHGDFRAIACRRLSPDQSALLLVALNRVHSALREPNRLGVSREHFVVAAKFACFLQTSSRHVDVAYTSSDRNLPLVILRHGSGVWFDPDELAITVLHELVHLLYVIGETPVSLEDRLAGSRSEAIHDLLCYEALGLGVSRHHWAFARFPDLLPRSDS